MEVFSLLSCQKLQYSPRCFSIPHRLPFPPRKILITQHTFPVIKKTMSAVMSSISNQIISGDTNNVSTIQRRSAAYKPNIWDFSFSQSLNSKYTRESYEKRSKKLQEAVRHSFNNEQMTTLARLDVIDNMERLGIGYLFKNEIKRALDNIAMTTMNQLNQGEEALHAISLHFRLLRQHGYEVSQDVFAQFMKDIDEMGNWKLNINEDDIIKGILSLYEASHLGYEGETILDEAKIFTTKYLKEIIKKAENNCLIKSPELIKQVKHSLELPLHWRMLRLEARWYIDNMSNAAGDGINSDLLELAKLDFNMVQAIYQDDFKDLSRWWRDLGLSGSDHQFSFARDRLMECFIWSITQIYEPQLGYSRRTLTKCNSLGTLIDDVYDVYGTFDELKLFTDVVTRWDIDDKAMEQLPSYMKICFQTLYNTVKEISNDILKEMDWDIEYYLKKGWVDICKAYLLEAKWYHNKYTPTLEEYLNNGWRTSGGTIMLIQSYLSGKQEITEKGLKCLETYTDLIRWSSMIVRLCNDSGTSTAELERGDVAKSIQCYMKESCVSEDEARKHIRHLTNVAWKKLNKDHRVLTAVAAADDDEQRVNAVNLARIGECMYMFGDGFGVQDRYNKDIVLLLMVKPIVTN